MLRALFDWPTRAVLFRNATVYLRNWRSAFIPPLLEPVIMFFVFGLGLGVYVGSMHYGDAEVPYLDYVAPGILTYTLFSTAFFECLYGSFVRMFYQRTFEGILGTAVERVHIIWAEICWGAFRAFLYAVCVAFVLTGFNLAGVTHLRLGSLLFLLPLAGLASVCFSSFALLFTARVPTIDHMNYPVFLVGIPLSLVSNTYFPADRIHPAVALVSKLNPLSHLSDLFRHFMLGGGPESWMAVSSLVIGAYGLVLCFIAHRWMDRRLEKES